MEDDDQYNQDVDTYNEEVNAHNDNVDKTSTKTDPTATFFLWFVTCAGLLMLASAIMFFYNTFVPHHVQYKNVTILACGDSGLDIKYGNGLVQTIQATHVVKPSCPLMNYGRWDLDTYRTDGNMIIKGTQLSFKPVGDGDGPYRYYNYVPGGSDEGLAGGHCVAHYIDGSSIAYSCGASVEHNGDRH